MLIATTTLAVDGSSPFPGALAALPVLGARAPAGKWDGLEEAAQTPAARWSSCGT